MREEQKSEEQKSEEIISLIDDLALKGDELSDDEVDILCNWVLAEKDKLEE